LRVVLLHARRTAYGAVRQLYGWADRIEAVDHEQTPLRRSRLIDAFHLIPDVAGTDARTSAAALREIFDAGDEEPTVVFAAKDDYLQLLSTMQETLGANVRFGQEVRQSVLGQVLSKAGLPELAERAGVQVPQTVVDDLDAIRGLKTPIIVKPALKRQVGLNTERVAFRLKVCPTNEDAVRAAEEIVKLNVSFVAQEVIGDKNSRLHTVGVVAREGEIVSAATAVKVRQFPRRFGECSLGLSTIHPELIDSARKIVSAAGMSGIAQIEFLEHAGQNFLIEVNPRLWSWHEIHAIAGTNLVRTATLEAIRSDPALTERPLQSSDSATARAGVRWQFLAMDAIHHAGRTVSLPDLIRDANSADLEAFWNRDDPAVAFAHWSQTLLHLPQIRRSTRRA